MLQIAFSNFECEFSPRFREDVRLQIGSHLLEMRLPASKVRVVGLVYEVDYRAGVVFYGRNDSEEEEDLIQNSRFECVSFNSDDLILVFLRLFLASLVEADVAFLAFIIVIAVIPIVAWRNVVICDLWVRRW